MTRKRRQPHAKSGHFHGGWLASSHDLNSTSKSSDMSVIILIKKEEQSIQSHVFPRVSLDHRPTQCIVHSKVHTPQAGADLEYGQPPAPIADAASLGALLNRHHPKGMACSASLAGSEERACCEHNLKRRATHPTALTWKDGQPRGDIGGTNGRWLAGSQGEGGG